MTRRLATRMICVFISLAILRPTLFPNPIAAQSAETATPSTTDLSATLSAQDEPPPRPTVQLITPTPTLVITEPPLTLQESASVTQISAGQSFSYALSIGTSSAGTRTIHMRTNLDKLLKITGANASSGGCKTGNLIICVVSAQRNQPATITLTVRVIAEAPAGQRIISQAVAQDDLYNTASSDQVIVQTVADTPAPTQVSRADIMPQVPTAEAGQPATGADPPADSDQSHAEQQAPAQLGGATPEAEAPVGQAVETAGAEESSDAGASPQPLTDAAATDSIATQQLPTPPAAPPEYEAIFSALPTPAPTYVPSQAGPPPPSIQAVPLPATAVIPSSIGIIVALFGLALVIRGVRRVRRANARLAAQGVGMNQLQPLLRAATSRQQLTAATIAGMERRSRLLAERLEMPIAPANELPGENSEAEARP